MNTDHLRPRPRHKQLLLLLTAGAVTLIVTATLVIDYPRERRQSNVADRGAQVMPFDLDQTTHVFQALDDGGLQTVFAKDPADAAQIRLIREHLRHEATRFSQGDFSDPAAIHGMAMPGLKELQAGAQRIIVRYDPLPNGGQIRYTTNDAALKHALHTWFEAQRSDHGRHAMP